MSRYLDALPPLLMFSSVWIGGCYLQAGAATAPQPAVVAETAPPPPPAPAPEAPVAVEAQPVETAPEYYYGGAHFYPMALGGEWCPIAEPHVHDFPPDHPEYYAYDDGYYYYAGRPGEVYIVGRAPVGVRVHVVREGEGHEWRRLPPDAHRPHYAEGHYPRREEHPAPEHAVAAHRVAEAHENEKRAEPTHESVRTEHAEHTEPHAVEAANAHATGAHPAGEARSSQEKASATAATPAQPAKEEAHATTLPSTTPPARKAAPAAAKEAPPARAPAPAAKVAKAPEKKKKK